MREREQIFMIFLLQCIPFVRKYLSEKCIKMNVSKTKIYLDISIPSTSISGWREYNASQQRFFGKKFTANASQLFDRDQMMTVFFLNDFSTVKLAS